MSGEKTINITFLFPSELRQAAKALQIVHDVLKKKESPTSDQVSKALALAHNALYGLGVDGGDANHITLLAEGLVPDSYTEVIAEQDKPTEEGM